MKKEDLLLEVSKLDSVEEILVGEFWATIPHKNYANGIDVFVENSNDDDVYDFYGYELMLDSNGEIETNYNACIERFSFHKNELIELIRKVA